MASASAMQASLPDWMIMPRNNSLTVTGLFGSMNMREPLAFHARSETLIGCSSFKTPWRRAVKLR